MKASNPAATSEATRRSASLGVLPPGYLPASRRSSITQYDSPMGLFRDLGAFGIQPREIESARIGQVGGFHATQRGEDGLGAPRILPLPFGQHSLDLFALRIVLRAAQLARDDGELASARVTLDQRFGNVRQRTDDDVPAVIGLQLRRHRLQPTTVKQIEEQRL